MTEPKYDEIRESMLEQLRFKKADTPFLRDMIESYIEFCREEYDLWCDLKKRGRQITVISPSTGKKAEKENPSAKNLIMVSRQRVDILRKLGFNVDTVILPDNDEDNSDI